ncbi:methylated-DNA-[protein]-cysteine S-methyltransferase [Sphingomonas zeicaulis]|uniref:methylated-DNA--[protein]-cysteine S-methyltransferase n=1 Tax=Sphingomonas zeicaulis TaxID=1632740 RepID=UPI003D22876B
MVYALEPVRIATSIGAILIEGDDDRLSGIRILPLRHVSLSAASMPKAVAEAAAQLAAYFANRLTDFDLPLAPASTLRGLALRDAIIAIPYGETLSYGALARSAGSAPRAIGQACARNPFPIIVPCHRVLGSGGQLGTYSAGDGPITKRWLLDHESPDPQTRMFQ